MEEDTTEGEMESYSGAVEQMDTMVITVSTLAIMSGIFGCSITFLNLYPFLFDTNLLGPLIFHIVFIVFGGITGVLGVLSILVGWGLWHLEKWAWKMAMAISIATLIVYLPSLSPIMIVINAVLIWFLRKPQVYDIYTEIEIP